VKLPSIKELLLDIDKQPDSTTCGPTSLQAVYQFYGDPISLADVIAQVTRLEGGGTLAVMLGLHALKRGYHATIYTYNLQVFDPTWFYANAHVDLQTKLRTQLLHKSSNQKLRFGTSGYLEFLELGGDIRFQDLTSGLIRSYLSRGIPILTGLSSTYLYNCSRYLLDEDNTPDDVRGESEGHFVVLYGYDKNRKKVMIADPLWPNPVSSDSQYYQVSFQRLLNSILLGMITYDANLLVIEKDKTGCPS